MSARARAEFHARLTQRRAEIEQAVIARVFAVTGTGREIDAGYASGLKAAISAAIDHGLEAVELGEERIPPAPPDLLAQARRAARAGVSLDTVLRRYFAGHALISDFLVEEAARNGKLTGVRLQRLLRDQAAVLDRVTAAVSEEHARETGRRSRSSRRREAERIERLLAGELPDISGVPYDFNGCHTGVIARGPESLEAIGEVARQLDRRLLAIRCEEKTAWAWFGGRGPLDPAELGRRASACLPLGIRLAIGEPAEGLGGWRLTHRQARAALPVALRGPEAIVRYADVALLASILEDDLLAASLRERYLAPLEAEPREAETLRKTLRAYLAAGRNVSSTAAALGVKRHTVTRRLREIERKLGRSLGSCTSEMEVVLRLGDLAQEVSNVGQ